MAPTSVMPTQRHRETGIRLPKALRDELNLDDSRHCKPQRNRARGGPPIDRKIQRKQQRHEKKSWHQHRSLDRSGAGQDRGAEEEVEEEDPFDVSDPSDIDALIAPKAKGKQPKPPRSEPKKPEPKPILKLAKPAKRKATEDLEDPAPKKSLSKGVSDKLAQDDAEVAYLEKKLKIKSGKTPKSLGDDGLDFLLEGLKDDYLDDRKERASKKNKEDRRKELMSSEGGGILGDRLDGGDGHDEGDEGLDESEDRSDGEDEFEGFSDVAGDGDDSGSSEGKAAVSKVRENPYKPGVSAETLEGKPSAGKYIPPSLRKPASTESERLTRLRRQIQGLINRLSEVKLIPILGDVEELYRANPRADVTNILTDILVSTLCDPSVLTDTYHILHGGFLAGLYKIIGTDVGANVVQRVVEEFISNHDKINGIADPSTAGKECTNLINLLSELYNFQVIGCVLIFDLIRMFLSELTELHTELLLRIVRSAGPQLRSDDPTALKSLVLLLQPAIARAGGHDKLSVRTKFMIETLTNLKNNRLKSSTAASAITAEHTIRMKKMLGTLNTRHLRATEPLRASLDDIKNTETKGKWWLVGASWAGGSAPVKPSEPTDQPAPAAYVSDDEDDSGMPDLLALAKQHRMNTEIRRAIFVTILSSTDFADAHARLLKLRLKRSQEREIPRVLLHCAAAEASYNPYYTLIARKLCAGHALRMTFTFTLWDYFRRFGEDDGSGVSRDAEQSGDEDGGADDADTSWKRPTGLRKIVNLARLYAALVAGGSLGIAVFKTLNWSFLQAPTRNFLEVFFTAVFTETKGDAWQVSSIFGAFADSAELVRGVLFFLKKRVKGRGVAASELEAKMVKRGTRTAVQVLEDILKQGIVGDV